MSPGTVKTKLVFSVFCVELRDECVFKPPLTRRVVCWLARQARWPHHAASCDPARWPHSCNPARQHETVGLDMLGCYRHFSPAT